MEERRTEVEKGTRDEGSYEHEILARETSSDLHWATFRACAP